MSWPQSETPNPALLCMCEGNNLQDRSQEGLSVILLEPQKLVLSQLGREESPLAQTGFGDTQH
jgi:hypothetical protein